MLNLPVQAVTCDYSAGSDLSHKIPSVILLWSLTHKVIALLINIRDNNPQKLYSKIQIQTTVFDKACAMELLQFANPFLEENCLSAHSWAKLPNPACSGPLLRVWDKNSGSHPDQSDRMLARLPRQRLGSRESRKKSLATHADYQIWEPTPFISFTASVLQSFSKSPWPTYT
jgi:hypothetical protein